MVARWLTLVALAGVLLVPARARAQAPEPPVEPDESVPVQADAEPWRALYEQGKVHYQLREYREAIDAFTEAYRLSRRPQLLFNIAQAHRLGGNCAAAARFYRTFLDASPGADPAPVQARIAEMDACVAAPPRTSSRRRTGLALGSGIGGGVGLLAAGAGVVLLVSAAADARAIEDACTAERPCLWAEQQDKYAGVADDRRLGGLLLVGGGVVAVAGGALLWWALTHDEVVPVSVEPRQGGAVILWGRAL
jgi:tetratricopeptide (TPR) repeat protein